MNTYKRHRFHYSYSRWPKLVPLLCVLMCMQASAGDLDGQTAVWRLEIANDMFFDSDNQFTGGYSLQKHSKLTTTLGDSVGAAFGKRLARFILPEGNNLYYREGWAIGQNVHTPEDLDDREMILNDVPYVGVLTADSSFIAFNGRDLSGFGLTLGWAGEHALGEQVHKLSHWLFGADPPRGWDNQLDDEPIANLFYMRKRKLWRRPGFDGAVGINVGLGNLATFTETSLEMRIGRMPFGFSYVPDPLGRNMQYDATIQQTTSMYGSIVLRATRFVHMLSRDGNTFSGNNEWTENNSIETEDYVGQLILGFNVERPTWAMRFNLWLTTDTIASDTITTGSAPDNAFGTITVERKW